MPDDHYGRMEKSHHQGYFEKNDKLHYFIFYIYLILYDIHLKWKHDATSYTFYKSYRQPKLQSSTIDKKLHWSSYSSKAVQLPEQYILLLMSLVVSYCLRHFIISKDSKHLEKGVCMDATLILPGYVLPVVKLPLFHSICQERETYLLSTYTYLRSLSTTNVQHRKISLKV